MFVYHVTFEKFINSGNADHGSVTESLYDDLFQTKESADAAVKTLLTEHPYMTVVYDHYAYAYLAGSSLELRCDLRYVRS